MCERKYICKIISNIIVIILVAGIMTYMSGCGKKQVDTANMADTSINDSQLVEDKVSSRVCSQKIIRRLWQKKRQKQKVSRKTRQKKQKIRNFAG